MQVLYPRCAGLDVHKDTVVACVRLVGEGPALLMSRGLTERRVRRKSIISDMVIR